MSALETSEELSRLPGRSCLDPHRLEEALGQLAHGWTPTFGVLNRNVCSLGLQLTLGCPACRTARRWRAEPGRYYCTSSAVQVIWSALTSYPRAPGPVEGRSFLAGDGGLTGSCCISLIPGPSCCRPRSRRGEGCLWHLITWRPGFAGVLLVSVSTGGLRVLGGPQRVPQKGQGQGGHWCGRGRAGRQGAGAWQEEGPRRRKARHEGGKTQDQIHVKEEGKQGSRIAPSPSFVVKHPFFLLSTKKGSSSSRPCLFPQRATSPHHSQQRGPCFSFRKFSVIFSGERRQSSEMVPWSLTSDCKYQFQLSKYTNCSPDYSFCLTQNKA